MASKSVVPNQDLENKLWAEFEKAALTPETSKPVLEEHAEHVTMTNPHVMACDKVTEDDNYGSDGSELMSDAVNETDAQLYICVKCDMDNAPESSMSNTDSNKDNLEYQVPSDVHCEFVVTNSSNHGDSDTSSHDHDAEAETSERSIGPAGHSDAEIDVDEFSLARDTFDNEDRYFEGLKVQAQYSVEDILEDDCDIPVDHVPSINSVSKSESLDEPQYREADSDIPHSRNGEEETQVAENLCDRLPDESEDITQVPPDVESSEFNEGVEELSNTCQHLSEKYDSNSPNSLHKKTQVHEMDEANLESLSDEDNTKDVSTSHGVDSKDSDNREMSDEVEPSDLKENTAEETRREDIRDINNGVDILPVKSNANVTPDDNTDTKSDDNVICDKIIETDRTTDDVCGKTKDEDRLLPSKNAVATNHVRHTQFGQDAMDGLQDNGEFPLTGFGQMSEKAEARLAARRAQRAEARDIRMREIERQRKEEKEREEKQNGTKNGTKSDYRVSSSRYTSRQDSDDAPTDDIRTVRKEVAELEEKWKKAMMNNAQLDNEKQAYRYQVELLKDKLEELEEAHIELQREHKDRCRELEHKKRDNKDLHEEVAYLKHQIQQRDDLIQEYGLVFISNDTVGNDGSKKTSTPGTAALVTPAAADILQKHEGNLDERLKQFAEEKTSLLAEVKKLKQKLEQEKERSALAEKYSTPPPKSHSMMNGPDIVEVQIEAQRQINDYKLKLSKAEQDITTLEGNVNRLESQVKRYKTSSESAEKMEEELKLEKRKLQRELRESQNQIDEVQAQNSHLQKRLEKLKSARNAMLK